MGGALALSLAVRHPELAGLVCINPATQPMPSEALDMVRAMVAEGERLVPGGGSDIADPDVVEIAYRGTPLEPLLSFMGGLGELCSRYGDIRCPLLLMTSRQDHVLDPAQSDALAAAYGGPVERVILERGYHVATLDYDKDIVMERAVEFARRVTA